MPLCHFYFLEFSVKFVLIDTANMHPILAIVGKPNVGKSRLFNRIVGRGKAIVADTPGITRDRHYARADWCGTEFIVVDTGGLDFGTEVDLDRRVSEQSLMAISDADVIVCLFDGRAGIDVNDRQIVDELRRSSKPVLFVVNKIDDVGEDNGLNPFYEFGIEELHPVSAEHGHGVDDLLDAAVKGFPPKKPDAWSKKSDIVAAVIGRPNVGKSTLVNRLAGEERVVAHEMPGTTRDAIDVEIDFEGRRFLFIDTAGVKKKWAVSERLEKFTAMRSLKTIDRAKIVLLLIDSSEGLTRQDQSLAAFVREQGKGIVLLVNKWDLSDADWIEYEKDLRYDLGDQGEIPIINISAKTGQNCLKVLSGIGGVHEALGRKMKTSELNRIVEKALENHHLPVYRGNMVRIYYATQTGTYPPAFSLFSNYPAAVPYAYRKYLMGRISEALGVRGIPVKIVCRKK